MQRHAVGLIVTLALGLFVVPLAVEAQSPAQVPRIGVLASFFSSRPPPNLDALREGLPPLGSVELEAFRQGLRDLGYVEGQSLVLEYRLAEGKLERLPALAEELVHLKVAVILAAGVDAVRAAQHATETIPIVFPGASDPVGQGGTLRG